MSDQNVFDQLRALNAAHQAGEITITEYEAAYRKLDRHAGTMCDCGRGIEVVRRDRGAHCALCHLEGRR